MNSEADMILKAQADIQHFEPLYHQYYEPIFRFVYRRTDEENAAADITSRVFMNAIKALPKYQIREVGFGAWLYKIAANEIKKCFRETKQRQCLSLEDEKVKLVMSCDDLEDYEEKQEVLMQLIAELDDDEIQILELKFFENKNFKEIAFILDKKESGIKMRMYRSLDKLKAKFDSIKEES
ncbi:sigma-70 family RNA polymerase sigma factor [Reichenbachiella agarivorans]|uniref:Sigma-70 family RNA polymerase sigma factor n=1 Tax=Reichenbachiella agarivorans TaxID=2979464 RepID=A0ABY6CRL9_9BACT|nr:sigma-70 family RNA polymerase sigma factor [Reichenbachiella agarivorans]UXP33152.1 sigma-70 family RNA polymerase sigma factor [Reichenbachiella agarivorans]